MNRSGRQGRKFRIRNVLISLFLMLCTAAAVFMVRKPMLIVSSAAFETVYGEKRGVFSRISLSLRAFRAVKPVFVPDNTDSMSILPAIDLLIKKRGCACILVSAPFTDLAFALAGQFPSVPVALVGDASMARDLPVPVHITPDRESDFYRAGKIAAVLARDKAVRVFTGQKTPPGAREAFSKAYEDSGKDPSFLSLSDVSSDSRPGPDDSCFSVDSSGISRMPDSEIVFSWTDPSCFPEKTVVIFDDSFYALSLESFRFVADRKSARVPSRVLVSVRKTGSIKLFLEIQAIAH